MMIRTTLRFLTFTLFSSAILLACNQSSSTKPPPVITAQGFTIEEVQNGVVGQFASLRLRIESMGRIMKLLIKERSYEVDLASTPEKNHFQLFGLKKKAKLHTDITLDFKNYINTKLVKAGEYEFIIEVVDKYNQSTQTTLLITLEEPEGKVTPIETGHFQLQREGKDQVSGSDLFGITWKTIDEIKVTIQISKAKNGENKLARFSIDDYTNLTTKEALAELISTATKLEKIEFDTANNAAAHQVVGIRNKGKYFLLKTKLSNTLLSQLGTTVTLDGEYKF